MGYVVQAPSAKVDQCWESCLMLWLIVFIVVIDVDSGAVAPTRPSTTSSHSEFRNSSCWVVVGSSLNTRAGGVADKISLETELSWHFWYIGVHNLSRL